MGLCKCSQVILIASSETSVFATANNEQVSILRQYSCVVAATRHLLCNTAVAVRAGREFDQLWGMLCILTTCKANLLRNVSTLTQGRSNA